MPLSMRVSRHVVNSSALGLALSCASLLPAAAQTATPEATQLPAISVEGQGEQDGGYNPARSALPKLSQPLLDTPQTVTIVPQAVMRDQNVTTLRDVLRNVPGISIAAGEGGAQGDNIRIRGFAANNDIFLDGMRDTAQYSRDPFNLEQVEVIKGASSSTIGRGTTGGALNQVSKAPRLQGFVEGSVTIGTDQTKRATADINQPLTGIGIDGAALRLNMMVHDSNVAGRDVTENKRWGFAPSIAFGLGTPTRVTLSYQHVKQENIPDYGVPLLNGRPVSVRRENWYGFDSLNTEETTSDIGTVLLEHDLNDQITLRNQFRYARSTRDAIYTPPRSPDPITNTVRRNPSGRDAEGELLTNQTDATVKFQTGGIGHTLVTGVEFAREKYDQQALSFSGAPLDNLATPNPGTPFTGTRGLGTRNKTEADTIGVYVTDTVELSEQFEITGGLRWDRFQAETDSRAADGTLSNFKRTDSMWSGRAALVYKPVPYGSVYVSYGTSFNPSAEGLSLNTNVTAPEKNITYEIGTKWDVLGERLSLNAALFRIDKTNARTPGVLPGDPPRVLEGEQRVDGFELGVSGTITDNWQIFGGYTYLHSEILESNTAAEVGKKLANTPAHSFSLWSTYDLPWNVRIGGGTQYMSSRYVNDTNTGKVPGYWLFDAMASYQVTEAVAVQLHVTHITDKKYYDGLYAGHVIPGPGRTVLLSTNFRF